MNTFGKVSLGFVGGAIFTIGALFILSLIFNFARLRNSEGNKDLNEKVLNETVLDKRSDIEYFEITTPKGDVTLHTYMPKDSVKLLMGKPTTVDIQSYSTGNGVHETWKYRGSNDYIDEFTLSFEDGELTSVTQYKDH